MRFEKIFFIFAILICAFEIARLWGIAPAQMAAHFNAQGSPDRFAPKLQFFWAQIQTFLAVTGASVVLQVLTLLMPAEWINIPNRDYWLAPERRAETKDRIGSFGPLLFGIVLLAIQAGFELSVYASLSTPILFNAPLMIFIMIVTFVGIGLLLVRLALSFRIPPSVG